MPFLERGGDLKCVFMTCQEIADRVVAGMGVGVGSNSHGSIGDNTTTTKSAFTGGVSTLNWLCIDAGVNSTIGLDNQFRLWSWGRNQFGQLGNNSSASQSSPVQIGTGRDWASMSFGGNNVAAIKQDGTLWTWGRAQYGALGNNGVTTVHQSSPVQTVAGGTNWCTVSAGYGSVLAVKTDGTLWAWGRNNFGQLGNSSVVCTSSPVQVGANTNWRQVSGGYNHAAAIKTDGTLWTWGNNALGQLGINSVICNSSPVQTISGGTNWKTLPPHLDTSVTAAIKTDGTLWLWGYSESGKLGNNTLNIGFSSPIQTVSGGTNWKSVSFSCNATHAVKSDGTAWSWGYNGAGKLGTDLPLISRSSPAQVTGESRWKQIAGAFRGGHTAGIVIR